MKFVLAFLLFTCFLGLSIGDEIKSCRICTNFHPQSIICNAQFVGIIRVRQVNPDEATSSSSSNVVSAEATILQVFKGSHEDFEVGSSIYLYAPSEQSCQIQFLSEDMLISGKAYNGGLLSTKCDLSETRSMLTKKQLSNIHSHIRNHAYQEGCRSCVIKRPYDYTPVQNNECVHPLNEFPLSTIACLPSKVNGKCEIVKTSKQRFIMPAQPGNRQPLKDFEGVSIEEPKENGCLLNRITTAASNLPVIPEEPIEPLESTRKPIVTPTPTVKSAIFRMIFDWSKMKAKKSSV